MKIYTKTGDKGETRLFNNLKVKKSNKIIEAIGSVDELIAWLGVLAEGTGGRGQRKEMFKKIQNNLMLINSQLAGYHTLNFNLETERLEKEIDEMEKKLPKLTNFIFPRGEIHIVRAVCRRAERRLASLSPVPHALSPLKYLNRLSDYLFVLARYVDWKKGKKELIWSAQG